MQALAFSLGAQAPRATGSGSHGAASGSRAGYTASSAIMPAAVLEIGM